MKKTVKSLVAALLAVFTMALCLVPSFALNGADVAKGVATFAGDALKSVDMGAGQTSIGTFQDVTAEYAALNAFRREPAAWYWNADNKTMTFSNTTIFNQLPALKRNAALEETAKVRAKEIVRNFSHTRPNGQRCFTAYPNMSALGENIAYGQSSIPEVMLAFMETGEKYAGQGHRRNMLNPAFNAVGLACYKVNGVCYWVQCFGKV